MPSIPQSLLWISLVVLWLFVLVPMLINKRDTVRRTSDVALATRVLNGGARSRLFRRSGPAAGHRHDPDWQRDDSYDEVYPDLDGVLAEGPDYADQREVIREYDDAVREARMGARSRSVVVVAAVTETSLAEPDYLDVDVVDENSGALPVGEAGVQETLFDNPPADAPRFEDPDDLLDDEVDREPEAAPFAEPVAETAAPDPTADEYEYVDDTSGLEAEYDAGPDYGTPSTPRSPSRQRRLTTSAEAAVSARKYRFRRRVLTVMAALMVLSAVLSFTVSPTLWWSCGATAAVTVLYLAYLRRQTRIEEQVRRRRQQRGARSRPLFDETRPLFEESAPPRRPEVDFTEFPTRLQHLGAAVLEIDDEDPVFEHLEEVQYSRRHYGHPRDLPRASGQ